MQAELFSELLLQNINKPPNQSELSIKQIDIFDI